MNTDNLVTSVPSSKPIKILSGFSGTYLNGFQLRTIDLTWSLDGGYIANHLYQWNLLNNRRQELNFDTIPIDLKYLLGWQVTADNQYIPVWQEMNIPDKWQTKAVDAISPDRTQIVIGGAVYNIITGERIAEIAIQDFGDERGKYSPDGKYFARAVYDYGLIWDTQTWEIVAEIPHGFSAIAWSPDGTQIALGVVWDVEIWDVAELIEAYQYLP